MPKFVTVEAHKVSIQMVEGLGEDEEDALNKALDDVDVAFHVRRCLEAVFHQRDALRGRLRVDTEQVE